jgi:hypothetical protein
LNGLILELQYKNMNKDRQKKTHSNNTYAKQSMGKMRQDGHDNPKEIND